MMRELGLGQGAQTPATDWLSRAWNNRSRRPQRKRPPSQDDEVAAEDSPTAGLADATLICSETCRYQPIPDSAAVNHQNRNLLNRMELVGLRPKLAGRPTHRFGAGQVDQ